MADVIGRSVIEIYADASSFEAAMVRAAGTASKFEAAATVSAGKAAGALAGVGAGANAAAGELDKASTRAVAAIQRQIAQVELAPAAYRAFISEMRGASSEAIGPYIARLEQATKAQEKTRASTVGLAKDLNLVGITAKQAEASLRQLPAQFTDIFTSLAGGQNPLLVFLQQGGQIKDQFGGIGNAAKVLVASITPLVVLLTGVAAAAGVLGYAYFNGAKEAEEYRKALVFTGNAAGTTAGQLQEAARAVSSSVGTQGKAAEVLAALAATGRVAAKDLNLLAEAAIRLEREGGPAVAETIKQFAELGKSPTKGAAALNEQTRFLTAAVYEQVRSLELQGKTAEAASVVQNAYATEGIKRSKDLAAQLGFVERGWRAVAEASKGAFDAVLNIGRQEDPAEIVKRAVSALAAARADLSAIDPSDKGARAKFLDADIKRLEAYIASAGKAAQATKELTKAQADSAAESLAGVKFSDLAEKFKSPTAALKEQVAEVRNLGLEGKKTSDEVRKLVASTIAYSQANSLAVASAQSALTDKALVEAEKSSGRIQALQAQAALGYLNEYELIQKVATESAKASREEEARLIRRSEIAKALPNNGAQVASFLAQAQAQAEKTANIVSKASDQIAEALNKRRIAADQLLFSEQELTKQEIETYRRDYSAKVDAAAASTRQYAIALDDAAHAHEVENSAALLGDKEREIRLKQLQIELDTRRRIREVQAQRLDSVDEVAAIERIKEQAVTASSQVADEVNRTFETRVYVNIRDTLTDAILDGGKSGAKKLQDLFKSLVLRPIVQAGVNSFLGGVGGGGGGIGGAFGGLSSVGNGLNGVGTLASGFGGFSAHPISSAFSSFSTSSAGQSLGLSSYATDAAIDNIFLQQSASAATIEAGAAAVESFAAAAGPYAAIALAIYALATSLDNSGTPHTGSVVTGDGQDVTTGGPDPQRILDNFNRQTDTALKALTGASLGALNSIASVFGGGAFSAVAKFAADGQDASIGGFSLSRNGQQVSGITPTKDDTKDYAVDPQEAFAAFSADASAAIRQAIDSIDLPKWARDQIAALGKEADPGKLLALANSIAATQASFNAFQYSLAPFGGTFAALAGLSSDALSALVGFSGGLESLKAGVSSYYKEFYSEQERTVMATASVTRTLASAGLQLPATREAFRALVEQQIALGDTGTQAVATLFSVSGAFAELHPNIDATTAAVASISDITRERLGLERALLQAQGDTAAIRRLDVAALDESNRALQLQIYAIQDAAAAGDAYKRSLDETAQATKRLESAQGNVKSALKAIADFGQNLRDQIVSTQSAIADVNSRIAASLANIAGQRAGLESQLLQSQGNTAALRERELASLDASNRALQLQIYATQDATAAGDTYKKSLDDVAQATKRVESAQAGVKSALQALADFGQTLRDQIASAQSALNDVRLRAADAVTLAKDRVSQALGAIASAADSAASRLTQAASAVQTALGRRASVATSIAGLVNPQRQGVTDARSALLQALQGLGGARVTANAALDTARQRITDAFLNAQSDATAATDRLAQLQNSGANATANLADQMARLSGSISDYLLELSSASAGIVSQPAVNRETFLDTANRAQAGDATAAGQLLGTAKAFIDASLAGSSSGAAFDADRRLVQQVLARVGGSAATAAGQVGADDSIAKAQESLDRALAEVERLRGIATQAEASLTANSIDLLAEWRTAQDAATNAQQAYLAAAAQAAALGVVDSAQTDAFSLAVTRLTTAQGDLEGMLARITAAGVDLNLADTRDSLQNFIDDYVAAGAAIVSANDEYALAVAANTSAAADLSSATTTAAANGVSLGEVAGSLVDAFTAAIAGLRSATVDANLIGAPGVAPSLVAEYISLQDKLATVNVSLAAFDAQVSTLDFSGLAALDPLAGLLSQYSAAVGELLTAKSESGAASDAAAIALAGVASAATVLKDAVSAAAVIVAPAVAPELLAEYAGLQANLTALNAQLQTFEERVTGLDFGGLAVLDPLGDLLGQYSAAVSELLTATDAQSRLTQTGKFIDIGGGFSKYTSSGGAVSILNQATKDQTLFGVDGRSFGLGVIQQYIAGLLAAGDFRSIYNEATAFGISSGDLDKITGAGTPTLAWAKSLGLPAFAKGGIFDGGLRLVGENGPELEATGPARYYSAQQTRSVLSGSSDNAGQLEKVILELQTMREENAAMATALAGYAARQTRLQERWDGGGLLIRGDNSLPVYTRAAT